MPRIEPASRRMSSFSSRFRVIADGAVQGPAAALGPLLLADQNSDGDRSTGTLAEDFPTLPTEPFSLRSLVAPQVQQVNRTEVLR